MANGMNRYAPLVLTVAVLLPAKAIAHAPYEGAGSFHGGVLHPLLVPAHALAILAAGLLIGQRPLRPGPAMAHYGAGLLIGFGAMIWAVVPQSAPEVLLAAAAMSGAVVALAWPVPKWLINALALVIGLALALDSPPHVISIQQANVIVIGTFCGAVMLLVAVVEAAAIFRGGWQGIAIRILGSWIAASAIMSLTLRLAR
jgi:urease accessory protein